MEFRIVNDTMDLSRLKDAWTFDEKVQVWCLEDVLYTDKATAPAFQRLSIFVPAPYMSAPGVIAPRGEMNGYTAAAAPVIFENNSAGYMQMPNTWLGGPRCYAQQYLERGYIYVSSGCRGHDSVDAEGRPCGKAPWTLVDLKTAIRFLRHNRTALPGNFDKIVSVGWSAGGAMSSLLGVTGNSPDYDAYLAANGAFMEERDDVFAAQIYCPIIDLEHASAAYEWCFGASTESEDNMEGPGRELTDFEKAISQELRKEYVNYFNKLGLKDPVSGEPFTLTEDGRGGPAYDYLMGRLNGAAAKYLRKLAAGELAVEATPETYISGEYQQPTRPKHFLRNANSHHAGVPMENRPRKSLGEMMIEAQNERRADFRHDDLVLVPGSNKRSWLSWDGETARVSDLDSYVLAHRKRMKGCPSFDDLQLKTPENSEFGTAETPRLHFDSFLPEILRRLGTSYPRETAALLPAYEALDGDHALQERIRILNPLAAIRAGQGTLAEKFRIRVGAQDADTSFSMSMVLAVMLMNAGKAVDYELVWDQPHTEADYPGEVCDWIEEIVK